MITLKNNRRFYIESRNGSYQVVEQVGEKYNVLDKDLTLNQGLLKMYELTKDPKWLVSRK